MTVSIYMIEKIVRAFLVIFILVALAMIVATILGFSAQVEEFLENAVPTRYQIMANSDAYIRKLSMGLLILAVPLGFYVVIRLLGMRESRREKILNPPFSKTGLTKSLCLCSLAKLVC